MTPNGHEIKIFDLDVFVGELVALPISSRRRVHRTPTLLKCYDECRTWPGPGGHGRPVEYTWADIGYDSPAGTCRYRGHGEPVCVLLRDGVPGDEPEVTKGSSRAPATRMSRGRP